MSTGAEGPFLNWAETSPFQESVDDRITWGILAMATTSAAMTIADDKRCPVGQFDMLFFAKIMREVGDQHDLLRNILGDEEVASLPVTQGTAPFGHGSVGGRIREALSGFLRRIR
jgi:hypothetical protein